MSTFSLATLVSVALHLTVERSGRPSRALFSGVRRGDFTRFGLKFQFAGRSAPHIPGGHG